MKRKIKAGTTNHMEPIRVYDSSSSTGAYLSGITHASSGLLGRYRREGDAAWTSISIVSATAGSFTSGGWAVPTSGPTSYEVHIPNAALAAGADWVEIEYYGVANMLPVQLFFELDAVDYQNADSFGLSRMDVPVSTRLAPTTPGRTATLSTGGAIKLDWQGIENPGATNNLNGTNIFSASSVQVSDWVSLGPAESDIEAIKTYILALNNLSAKMNIFGAPLLEIPETGTTVYAFTVVVKDDEDKLVNLDASPTIAAANAIGTNRSANLSAVSNPSTGRYTFTYSVANTHAKESLRITVSGTVSAEARYIEWIGAAVDYDTTTLLQSIDSALATKPTLVQIEASSILAKEATVSSRATQASVDTKPTLAQIEGSTVLAKEATLVPKASQASVDTKPTLIQIESSSIFAKETTLTNRPTLAQIEASSVLAKEATVSAVPNSLLDTVVENGLTVRQCIRLANAVLHGAATGMNTSPVFKSLDGTKDRVVGTVSSGNRIITSRDGS